MNAVFDHGASLKRMGDDQQLFREMAALLTEDGPRRLDDLARGVERYNGPQTTHAAHTLKGLAANFSASRAVQAAAEVERLGRDRRWDSIGPAVKELRQAFDELQRALEPFVARASAAS